MHIVRWPDEFADSTPAVDFDARFVAFLDAMRASGSTVFADPGWSLFEFCRGDRSIHFVRRGRSCKIDGVHRANLETYWEVRPEEKGITCRLASLFGIREFACVVVFGLPNIQLITTRWLDGASVAETVSGVPLWDRLDPSLPLHMTT